MSERGLLPVSEKAADRLRAIRKVRGISVEELANQLTAFGYTATRATLTNIENGRYRAVPIDLIVAAMKYFNMNFSAFMQGPLCSGCKDDPPQNFICQLCNRFKDHDGKLVRC